MIQAFAKSGSQAHLVLAGPHDYFLNRILSSLTKKEKAQVVVKERQSLGELATWYSHAEALIHPSISEGFGLPVVEAMHFGIPVIASHIPVFQEILGESHYSFDPFEERSIAKAIQTFEGDKKKKKNVLKKAFSFDEMARATVNLYLHHV